MYYGIYFVFVRNKAKENNTKETTKTMPNTKQKNETNHEAKNKKPEV